MVTSGIGELLSLGRDTTFVVSQTRTCRMQDIAQLQGLYRETGHWLHVSGARYLTGQTWPFSVNEVFVPARFAALEPLLSATRNSVYQAIEDSFDVAVGRVSQRVRAIACPSQAAVMMGLAANAPVLEIEAQLVVRDGGLMEVSVAIFDPARFQVRTDVEID